MSSNRSLFVVERLEVRSLLADTGSILGTLFIDQNANGRRDGIEAGTVYGPLATVYLDLNRSGGFDAGEPKVNSTSQFQFTSLATGTYAVRTLPASGYRQTNPAGGIDVAVGTGQTQAGAVAIEADYSVPADIVGLLFTDSDFDGVHDPGEGVAASESVRLDLNQNKLNDAGEPFTVTDRFGEYRFINAPVGTYDILPSVSTAYLATVPSAVKRTVTFDGAQAVVGQNFGFVSWSEISRATGVVFVDADGDGVRDAGEQPVPNAVVFHALSTSGTVSNPYSQFWTTTDADGAYAIVGPGHSTFNLRVLTPPGWVASPTYTSRTFDVLGLQTVSGVELAITNPNAAPPPAAISGYIFNDLDADGVRDAGEFNDASYNVYIDVNNDGVRQSSTEQSVAPDRAGNYVIGGLAAGTYTLRTWSQFNRSGWSSTVPVGGARTVTVLAGQMVNGQDFGLADLHGEITGFVYNDRDRDGVRDDGEGALANTSIGLQIDLDQDGIFGESSFDYALVRGDGMYTFSKIPPGTYQLKLTLPAGVVQTAPAALIRTVVVAREATTPGVDFGVADTRRSISGTAFYDNDRDGIKDPVDAAIAGRYAYLADANGALIGTAITSAAGVYQFHNVVSGTYRVRLNLNSGEELTRPADGQENLVVVDGEDRTAVDFGVRSALRDYNGRIFSDLNGNTFWSVDEPGIANVVVWADLDRDAVLDTAEPRILSAADGKFHFILDPDFGAYQFRIQMPAGYVNYPGKESAHESGVVATVVVPVPDWGLFPIGTTSQQETIALSSLTPGFASNFWGPWEKDRSNGEQFAGDGRTITLNGKTYAKGVGLHAASELRYDLAGKYTRFQSDVGIDDEVGNGGSVNFKVYADNVLIYESGRMTGASATKSLDVDVTGKQVLRLVVDNAGDGASYDHADFADAKLLSGSGIASPPKLSIADARENETVPGFGDMQFVVTLDHAYALPVAVDVSSADGTARSAGGSDRGDFSFGAQTITFLAGETRKIVLVRLTNDFDVEPEEFFTLNLSNARNATIADGQATGTIVSEDVPPPRMSVADGSVIEGNGDGEAKSVRFTVSIDHNYHSQVSADYVLIAGSAAAGSDFESTTGTITVGSDLTRDVYIRVTGDTTFEPNETFTLKLLNFRNATAGDDTATGTILNDDADPSASPTAVHVSDLTPTFARNFWGPWEKDKSNGEKGAGDGRALTLNGKTYAKGLGLHASADLRYALAGKYVRFQSDVGVDDEVGSGGSVVFQVWADSTLLFDSGVMTGASPTQKVDVALNGRNELRLAVLANGPETSDHADWADPKLFASVNPGPPPANIAPTAVDDIATMRSSLGWTLHVLTNDGDPDGTLVPSTLALLSGPAHGVATLVSDSSGVFFRYHPSAGFSGTDGFKYTVKDNAGATSNVATVTLIVLPNVVPIANDDAVSTSFNTPITFYAIENDVEETGFGADGLALVTGPAHGTVRKDNLAFVYTPATGFIGTDAFTYRYTDDDGAMSNVAKVTITVTAASTAPVYLGDVNSVSSTNGWGAYEKNKSNNEQGANDGSTIRLNGKTYAKGLGTHAKSEIVFNVPAGAKRFVSDIGIDDEVGNGGSVLFKVFNGSSLLFGSTKITGASATQTVDVGLAGATQLRLVVEDAGDGVAYDHGDWADARFTF